MSRHGMPQSYRGARELIRVADGALAQMVKRRAKLIARIARRWPDRLRDHDAEVAEKEALAKELAGVVPAGLAILLAEALQDATIGSSPR